MVGFPKNIKTRADLVNTYKLVKKGKLKKEDWLAAVEKLEGQNWIVCPILSMSEDRKTVTLNFCNEAEEGQKIRNGSIFPTINGISVETEEQTKEDIEAGKTEVKHTVLTLSRALLKDTVEIGIPAAVTFYERLGIAEAEVEEMKGALQ
jgi:hypothetical protein